MVTLKTKGGLERARPDTRGPLSHLVTFYNKKTTTREEKIRKRSQSKSESFCCCFLPTYKANTKKQNQIPSLQDFLKFREVLFSLSYLRVGSRGTEGPRRLPAWENVSSSVSLMGGVEFVAGESAEVTRGQLTWLVR